MLRSGLFAAACLTGTAASAQPQTEIVVTGRGLGATQADRAYDVIEITRERLTSSASNRLEDLLRDIPGFQLFRRSDASSANPTSQGVTLRALGGNASSRALLVLDGVPQTDPFGGWIAWPAYAAVSALVFSYWLGEREELIIPKKKGMLKRSHSH